MRHLAFGNKTFRLPETFLRGTVAFDDKDDEALEWIRTNYAARRLPATVSHLLARYLIDARKMFTSSLQKILKPSSKRVNFALQLELSTPGRQNGGGEIYFVLVAPLSTVFCKRGIFCGNNRAFERRGVWNATTNLTVGESQVPESDSFSTHFPTKILFTFPFSPAVSIAAHRLISDVTTSPQRNHILWPKYYRTICAFGLSFFLCSGFIKFSAPDTCTRSIRFLKKTLIK